MTAFVSESYRANLEIHALDGVNLDPQQVLVPPCIKRQLVVSQHVGALLCLGPALGHNGRDF